jgi:hypothetical protein
MLEGIRGLLEFMFGTIVMVADEKSLVEATSKIKTGRYPKRLALRVA